MNDDTAKQITKNQHFVPKFYLKRFCDASGNVKVFDCTRNAKGKSRHPSAICCEDYFYAVETGVKDEVSQHCEAGLKSIEDLVSSKLESVLSNIISQNEICDSDKAILSTLMSMLWLRCPQMRNQINKMQDEIYRNMLKFTVANEDVLNRMIDDWQKQTGQNLNVQDRQQLTKTVATDRFKLKFNNAHHLNMLPRIKKYAQLFLAQYWTIFISRCNSQFITTDNPLTVKIPKTTGFYGASFLERTHFLALSPEVLIECKLATTDGKRIKRRNLFEDKKKTIEDFNIILLNGATQYAYSNTDSFFDELSSTLKVRGLSWQPRKQEES